MPCNKPFIFSHWLLALLLLPIASLAHAQGDWDFAASVYGWFPDISGQTAFGPQGGSTDFTVEVGDVLDNLQFTLQGSFDARRDHFGLFADVIYMDLGNTESVSAGGTIGNANLPVDISADLRFDMKSWIWTAAGYVRLIDEPARAFDMHAGFRFADIKQTLGWSLSGEVGDFPLPGRDGESTVDADYWDFVVGLRGRFSFGGGDAWFIPYYVDIGTGESDFTWQAMVGLGYEFGWGDVFAAWRYLDYDLPSGKPAADLNFSGPAVAITFRW